MIEYKHFREMMIINRLFSYLFVNFVSNVSLLRELYSSLSSSAGQVAKYFGSTFSSIRLQIPGGARCICAFGSDRNTIVGKILHSDEKWFGYVISIYN